MPGRLSGQALRQPRTEVKPPGDDGANGGHELLRCAVFREIAGRSRSNGAQRKLIFRVHAQDEDRHIRLFPPQLLQNVQTVTVRQREIEQNCAPLFTARAREAVRGIRCICADDDVGGIGEKLADALPDEAVVVDDEDSNHRPLPSLTARDLKRRFASGIVATTVVPRRGALRTVQPPPSRSSAGGRRSVTISLTVRTERSTRSSIAGSRSRMSADSALGSVNTRC